jgi:hypothetical protein
LGGAHAAGDLGLRELGHRARADKIAGERELGFEGVVFAFNGRILELLAFPGFETSYSSISIILAMAISSSPDRPAHF